MSRKHAKKISVDLRGFHIFDDGDSSSDENDDPTVSERKAQRKALKERFKHAKKMSVDLGGYHLFDDGGSSDDEENENGDGGMAAPQTKKMHNKKISVDLRGFDLFDDSDSEEDDDDDENSSDGPGKVKVDQKNISKAMNDNFKKAQKLLSKEAEEDNDLKGFHLFDEYNDDDDSDEVIKLHEMEQGQLEVLVRNLLIENAILKDAASRARQKLDSRKETIKSLEANKMELVKSFASELNNMRDIIRSLGGSKSSTPW